jgi:quercetin dioxygenase-like cupin family protein
LGIAAALAVLPGAAPGNPGRPGTQTLHFDHERVARAFEKGEVIFGGDGGANYMVHASRREGPGHAEVHALDTDIIYVIDGTATLVTEGTVVRPKTIEPNEIRGPEIAGGKSLPLTKGDVAIVPKGIPHWFRDVPGPFTYYVVKVR